MKPELQSSPADTHAGQGVGSLRERILLHPENYVGSVEKRTQKLWVYESRSMKHREVTYVPGLYKIFDEVLLFAADNKQRDPTMNFLNVAIDAAQCRFSFYYNGDSVLIDMDREDCVYVAEMLFGHLTNYEHNAEEITGGSIGYGVKLANIFSTEFIIEIADSHREKKYKQVFSENMGKKSEPQVTVYLQGINWTRITFKPDLAKFNMAHLDHDILSLIRKRIFDVASMIGMTVQVVFNGENVPLVRNFKHYAYHYTTAPSRDADKELPRIYERVNDQWEVCVSPSNGCFQQVSFVNKFATTAGGTHVDYVSNQIATRIAKFLNEKLQNVNIEAHEVKKRLWLFVNAFMEDPTFDSPTKDTLTTPQESFGFRFELSDEFVAIVAGYLDFP